MFFCQKLVVATWTTISAHTLLVDAIRQMNPITGGVTPGNLNSYQVVDGSGTVYATQAPLNLPLQILPSPVQTTVSSLLSNVFP